MSDPQSEESCKRPCNRAGASEDYIVNRDVDQKLVRIKKNVAISDFVRLIDNMQEEDFESEVMADFLRHHPIDLGTLEPYRFYHPDHYARNLIASSKNYEIMLLCWEPGQETAVHNHGGQSCWVYVLDGQLSFRNYKWLGCDRSNRKVNLEEQSRIPMAAKGSMSVIDERDAIHRLKNDQKFDNRALSLHIYSKPITSCAVYDMETGKCRDKKLEYFSVSGLKS